MQIWTVNALMYSKKDGDKLGQLMSALKYSKEDVDKLILKVHILDAILIGAVLIMDNIKTAYTERVDYFMIHLAVC